MKDIKSDIKGKFRNKYLEKFGVDSLSKENNYGALVEIDTKSGQRAPTDPTFWEFVQWFISEKHHLTNEHWIPISNFCGLCRLEYDYIIQSEDFGKNDQLEPLKKHCSNIKNLPQLLD